MSKIIHETKHVVKAFLIRESDGKIIVLTRSDNKKISPGKWEYSAGGGVDAGETHEQALAREMWEEIKTKVNNLERFGETQFLNHYTGNQDKIHLYFGKIDKDIEWFAPNEVKAVDYLSLEEIKNLIETHGASAFDLGFIHSFEQLVNFLSGKTQMSISQIQKAVQQNKIKKGFNLTDANIDFCLLYGEVAEAYNAWRKKKDDLDEELADVAIYLLGIAEMVGVDLESAITKKMKKNAEREYKLKNGVLVKNKK